MSFTRNVDVESRVCESENKNMSDDIQSRHMIDDLATGNRWQCIKIRKGIPGLKQATILAY